MFRRRRGGAARARREPSLLGKLIDIHWEQARRRKALRELARLEWSFEFLVEVVRSASRGSAAGVSVEVESPRGQRMTITSRMAEEGRLSADDDIFNRLDDMAAVERFIRDHAPARGRG